MEDSGADATSETSSIYQYSDLEQRRNIRLIRVLSQGVDTPKIYVEFEIVSLDAIPHAYHAISYCWGDPAPVDKVWLTNGQFLHLTASAAYIMRQIVRSRTTDYFWIDALCINQNDDREKSHQIRLMRDIYGSAEEVLIFIGDSTDDDPEVIEFLKTLRDATKQLVERQNIFTMQNLCEVAGCHRTSSEWRALNRFLDRPWFKRIWVIQEVVCANKPTIFYGGHACGWYTVAYFLFHLLQNGLAQTLVHQGMEQHRRVHSQPDGINFVPLINNFKQRAGKIASGEYLVQGERRDPITLEDALLNTQHTMATDDRDKVLALIGLATDLDLTEFDAGYQESPQQLYTRTTLHILSSSSSLDILGAAGVGFSRKLSGLPSWVPDFSTFDSHRGITLGFAAVFGGYRATRDSRISMRTQLDQGSISLRGHLVERVATTSRPRPVFQYDDDDIHATKRAAANNLYWFKQTAGMVRALANRSAKYTTGEDWMDAYWRTIISNVTHKLTPAPSNYRNLFRAYILGMWWFLWLDQYGDFPESDQSILELVQAESELGGAFASAMTLSGYHRFFTTAEGYFGLGPPGMADDDVVCVALGGKAPFLLRCCGEGPSRERSYALVGECYVHGLMNGEGLHRGETQLIMIK